MPCALLLFVFVRASRLADQRGGGSNLQRGRPNGEHHLRCPRGRTHGREDEHHRARDGLPDKGEEVFLEALPDLWITISSLFFFRLKVVISRLMFAFFGDLRVKRAEVRARHGRARSIAARSKSPSPLLNDIGCKTSAFHRRRRRRKWLAARAPCLIFEACLFAVLDSRGRCAYSKQYARDAMLVPWGPTNPCLIVYSCGTHGYVVNT